MRSVSVVLPASMCAAIPMFRVLSSGNLRFGEFGFVITGFSRIAEAMTGNSLPTEVGERAVGLRHLVGVVALLDRVALTSSGVPQLVRQSVGPRHAAPVVGIGYDPAHRERNLTGSRYLHRNLVCGAADAARFHLETRAHILQRLIHHFERIDRIGSFARL